ncbi:MAG: alanine dehydrogenase [Nitrospirae bacterium]|nr:alanine dehydrogenase [Nitrospirota bacterium]MCL5237925.1 alanine dehydrogenase [Nitrospirota bacterium]
MIIGVPKEIKKEEYRVSVTPFGAGELKKDGHTIFVETGAGEGSGFPDSAYRKAGADIAARGSLFKKTELLVKVKEPLPSEFDLIRGGQAIFTFLHLAPNRALTELLLNKRVTAFGYETLQKDGALPLLAPMSEIAGRMAPLAGAYYLQKIHGGSGILPMGAWGVKPARALILGAGAVGTNAARICIGLEMDTIIMDKDDGKLRKADELFMGRVRTLPLEAYTVAEEIKQADIIIGAVLVPGGKTPVLITRDMLGDMRKGSVIIDVSVDQGGCVETSRPTTHDKPVYEVEGIIHYTVANMPGAYPRTSTLALTNATFPYIRALAGKGIEKAIDSDPVLRSALNTCKGKITNQALADSFENTGGVKFS